jgi:hypothetical protein
LVALFRSVGCSIDTIFVASQNRRTRTLNLQLLSTLEQYCWLISPAIHQKSIPRGFPRAGSQPASPVRSPNHNWHARK